MGGNKHGVEAQGFTAVRLWLYVPAARSKLINRSPMTGRRLELLYNRSKLPETTRLPWLAASYEKNTMRNLKKEDIENSSDCCDETILNPHLEKFVSSFIFPNRQEKWKHLFLKNRKRSYQNSSKLESHLTRQFCFLLKKEELHINIETMGVFYNFRDSSFFLSLKDALILGDYQDAIFSIIPGELALYFSHEGRIWLCQNK
ncbi:MAG: hypothetical protein DRR19_25495 [Candidatus Parabeggiatoa sp. nov. 1]|nr:MAG: hypothetical protein DRR19_25495 [Gammaproteobacteria bacterium]